MNGPDMQARLQMLQTLKLLRPGEALFRPSNAKTWLHCPGHVQLAVCAPKGRSSDYAREGTAAHIVLAEALRDTRQPDEWVDRRVQLDGPQTEGWLVDAEMAENVQDCLDVIDTCDEPGTQIFIEHALSLGPLDPADPFLAENRGTGDVVILNTARRKLTIFDLKYGRGIPVPADAPQLRDYALMALIDFPPPPGGWVEIELIVGQPRSTDPEQRFKRVSFHPDTLLEFSGEIYAAMMAALAPEPALVPDPTGAHRTGSWCYYCPAKADCPALRAQAVAIGTDAFRAVPLPRMTAATPLPAEPLPLAVIADQGKPAGTDAQGVQQLPNVTGLSGEQVATVLDRRVAWDTWITAVEERAVALLGAGGSVPGWKLAARTGNRRYNPDIVPMDIAKAAAGIGLPIARCYTDPVLLSPAKLEKALPRGLKLDDVQLQLRTDKKDATLALVIRPLGEPTLTRAETAKPALPGAFTALPKAT